MPSHLFYSLRLNIRKSRTYEYGKTKADANESKVWIIKNETLSEIENGIASVIFDQSIWNFVKITISQVL